MNNLKLDRILSSILEWRMIKSLSNGKLHKTYRLIANEESFCISYFQIDYMLHWQFHFKEQKLN